MEPTRQSLTLGSLFDGIGGWQLTAMRNGIKPIWSSEIEPYPMAVTKAHFPDTIQLGDITKLNGENLPPARIFLVADFGAEKRRAAELLFVEQSLQGHPQTCRESDGETASRSTEESTRPSGRITYLNKAYCLQGNMIDRKDANGPDGPGFRDDDKSYTLNTRDRHVVFQEREAYLASGKPSVGTLMANASTKQWLGNQEAFSGDYFILEKERKANTVRRLTVIECERLQGLPDGWTNVPWNNHPARDSGRIKAIGNGMAQPCADFILRQLVFYHSQISP